MDKIELYMKKAAEEAIKGVKANDGGPFGAVIVRNGKIIASCHNEVIKSNDPTAHAEVNAIRKASKLLGRFDLSDCIIYSSCEPCPMCLAAIHWAKFEHLYFGCTKHDAEAIGFDDSYICDVIKGTNKTQQVSIINTHRDVCLEPFNIWKNKTDKVQY